MRRGGFTRLAKALELGDDPVVDELLITSLKAIMTLKDNYVLAGVYLNYYKDGTHHTPTHSHKGMVQMVISLGAERPLVVGKEVM